MPTISDIPYLPRPRISLYDPYLPPHTHHPISPTSHDLRSPFTTLISPHTHTIRYHLPPTTSDLPLRPLSPPTHTIRYHLPPTTLISPHTHHPISPTSHDDPQLPTHSPSPISPTSHDDPQLPTHSPSPISPTSHDDPQLPTHSPSPISPTSHDDPQLPPTLTISDIPYLPRRPSSPHTLTIRYPLPPTTALISPPHTHHPISLRRRHLKEFAVARKEGGSVFDRLSASLTSQKTAYFLGERRPRRFADLVCSVDALAEKFREVERINRAVCQEQEG